MLFLMDYLLEEVLEGVILLKRITLGVALGDIS